MRVVVDGACDGAPSEAEAADEAPADGATAPMPFDHGNAGDVGGSVGLYDVPLHPQLSRVHGLRTAERHDPHGGRSVS